tara:strand:- start:2220 stop:2408 length:189 start_codon:yes stop_codon:yes gene_type:complete
MNILRLKEVMDKTGVPRSTIYKYMKEGVFPQKINLSSRSVGWIESEVNEWIEEQINKSRKVK